MKPALCRVPGCPNPKREGYATCPEHAPYEQWAIREYLHIEHCPCFPPPEDL